VKKVFLHGALADHLGFEQIELDVRSVGEAVRAIEANTGSLYSYLIEKDKIGIRYRLILGEKDHTCEEDFIRNLIEEEIHIVPVPMGYKAAARVIAGIVLIVAGYLIAPYFPVVSKYLIQTGLILAIGGIAELVMAKKPPENPNEETSFLFNNQVNTVRQGGPLGLAYGEFICGSQLINFDITSEGRAGLTGPILGRIEGASWGIGYVNPPAIVWRRRSSSGSGGGAKGEGESGAPNPEPEDPNEVESNR
jgi:predicted phage tail protein